VFKVNDLVLYRTPKQFNLPKLSPNYLGPYTILKQISPTNYEINRPNQPQGLETQIVHASKLRIYYPTSNEPLSTEKELCELPVLDTLTLPNLDAETLTNLDERNCAQESLSDT
jgi:hypothetical protein